MAIEPFIPTERDETNTRIPLYKAIGLTEAESNAVYFAVSEDIIPTKKTVAECLKAIIDRKGWSDKQKVWAAFNLNIEMLARKGVPRILLKKIDSGD